MARARSVVAAGFLLLAGVTCSRPVDAQSFDCAKAGTAIERAICASDALKRQDQAMADALAQAVARDPDGAAALRQSQRQWLSDRAACAKPGSVLVTCLATVYAARIAALAPPAAAAATSAPPVASSAPAPTRLPTTTLSDLAGPARGAASFDRESVPAAGAQSSLLNVAVPGRYAIEAKSTTGTAIQLVDMLTGPGDVAGEAGRQDGRLDLLLDAGVYKVRTTGAAGAPGDVLLTVVPFTDAAPPLAAPVCDGGAGCQLADLQQRFAWLSVGADGIVHVEAAGRSLRDLRLWRNGRDLVDIAPATRVTEPVPARPLTDLALDGTVEPGTYLVAVYGGPPLNWTDGAADQPLLLRSGVSDRLATWAAAGQIDAFGTAVFAPPDAARRAVLRLPSSASAELELLDGGGQAVDRAAIVRQAREPVASLSLADGKGRRLLRVSGATGQGYTLRLLAGADQAAARTGEAWLAVQVEGAGGDGPPPSFVLVRRKAGAKSDDDAGADADRAKPDAIVIGEGPRVGLGRGWRGRFNLAGPTSILFEVTAPLDLGAKLDGLGADIGIATLAGARLQPRGDGKGVPHLALDPGWYRLLIQPRGGATGLVDLTLGAPNSALPGVDQVWPATPVIPVGVQTLADGETYRLFRGTGPGMRTTLLARPTPVDLATAVVVTQRRGEAIDLPVRTPTGGGTLASRDANGGDAGAVLRGNHVRLPAAPDARTVGIVWQVPTPTSPPVRPEAADTLPDLPTGRPVFIDLARDERRSFGLLVDRGGLTRVETTGRLRTAGTLGTAFVPVLERAEANGPGQNMLVQRPLRAGRYVLTVQAKDSAGRAGIMASGAPLRSLPVLSPGGSVRAALAAGSGAEIPIDIAEPGSYHFDVLGLAQPPQARLDDSAGWPLLPAGALDGVTQPLTPGRYRLLLLPGDVEARVALRLDRVVRETALAGHGPHVLPFGAARKATWREPAGSGESRTPDVWRFGLQGTADVTLSLGDGTVGELRRADAAPDATPLARIVPPAPFGGHLQAGEYRLAVTSLGRNDRLDYTVQLDSKQLQPGVRRVVSLPETVSFSLAEPRVASLTSFGKTPVRAVLREASGRQIAASDGRPSDWNIAISRPLPAGDYTLDVASLLPTGDQAAASSAAAPSDPATPDSNQGDSNQSGSAQGGAAAADQGDEGGGATTAADEQPTASGDSPDNTGSDAADAETSPAAPSTELTLALPKSGPAVAAAADGTLALSGEVVSPVALPDAPAGALLLIAASAPVELALSVERKDAAGGWTQVGQDQGLSPLLAIPVAKAASGSWRASVWAIGGGTVPLQVAARVVEASPQPPGRIALAPVLLGDGFPAVRAALLDVPGATMLRVTLPPAAQNGAALLLGSGAPDRPAVAVEDGSLAPQVARTWLVQRGGEASGLEVEPVAIAAGSPLQVGVPAAGQAFLGAAAPRTDRMLAYLATAGFGQPGIDAGLGMGVAAEPGSAFAVAASGAPVRVWNAGGDDATRVRVQVLDLARAPERQVDATFSEAVPPGTALPLRLPSGAKRLDVSLDARLALIAGASGAGTVTEWAGGAPLSRSLEGAWTDVLLVNTGASPAAARLTVASVPRVTAVLSPGAMLRRFDGAAGSLAFDLDARPGQRLMVTGADATLVGADGQVRRGASLPLSGPGRVVLTHGVGLLGAWVEGAGASPFPTAPPTEVSLPARVPLANEAMRLRLSPGAPVLLRLRSSAPVILAVGDEPPRLYPAGAAGGRYLPAGTVEMRVLSPHDGPLSGTLELDGAPVIEASEGVGPPLALAPGGTAAWSFAAMRNGPVGVGVRAVPDQVTARLLDPDGHQIGVGVAQLGKLKPGRYLLEVSAPDAVSTTIVRPAILGIEPHRETPPEEVVRRLMLAAGLTPPG